MIFNNTKSKQFRVDCYIIQLVSTRLRKNWSSHKALVLRKKNLCIRVALWVADRLKILGCIKTLEDITIIAKLDWGTQSPLKKKFSNNGEILSKSRYQFFELFQFYFIFHYLLCSRYFVRCYLQKQDFLYNPPIWFTLRYFEFSHNFNIFLKL